ncbi:hypothetical protein MTO96_029463 [Rhipicephalus appendiculatus]
MGESSEMSSMSSMSSVESSSVDSSSAATAAPSQDWKRRAMVPAALLIAFVLLLIGIAVFTSSTSGGDDADEESGGSDDDTNGPASYSNNPPGSSKPDNPDKPDKPDKPVNPINPPAPKHVTELILCAVPIDNQYVVNAGMSLTFPSDGLCDYLFIMGLAYLVDQKGNEFNLAFYVMHMVRNVIEKTSDYTRTELGVALSASALDTNVPFSDYMGYSNGIPARIRHFGCLHFTLGGDQPTVDVDHKNLKAIFPVFKSFQKGNPSGKTVLALGLRTRDDSARTQYNFSNYENMLKEFAEIPSLDILVSITSTSREPYDQYVFAPPFVTNVTNKDYLSLEQASQFFSPSSGYGHKNITFGVSLEFGATVAYWTNAAHWNTIKPFDNLTVDCQHYFTISPDQACDAPAKTRKYFAAEDIWGNYIDNGTWASYFLYDTNKTLHDKVSYVRSQHRRDTFAWLVYDIHHVASSANCDWDPYYLLKLLKGIYK